MKKKLFSFVIILQLFWSPLFSQLNLPPLPEGGEGEEISEEEFAKLVEEMVKEIEKEIKKEEEKRTKEKEVAPEPAPQIVPPAAPSPAIPTDKRTNFLQPWSPTTKEEGMPPYKKEALDFYLAQLEGNLSALQGKLAALTSYEREKFADFKVNIGQAVAQLGQIKDEEAHQTSIYDEKFNGTREAIIRLGEELKRINLDIKVETGEKDLSIEKLYEAAQEKIPEVAEEKAHEKKDPTPMLSEFSKDIAEEFEEYIPDKKEVALSEVPLQNLSKPETPLPWYQKLLNGITNPFKAAWNYFTSFFTGKKETTSPGTSKPQTKEIVLPSKEKQLEAIEKTEEEFSEEEGESEFLNLIKTMQEGLKGVGKDRPVSRPKPSSPTVEKMAWKKFLKLLQQGEFKKLNNQLKEVIAFSSKAIEEKRKQEEEKVKKAEEEKRRREEREGRGAPSAYPSTTPRYPSYQQYPTYGGYGGYESYQPENSRSGAYSPTQSSKRPQPQPERKPSTPTTKESEAAPKTAGVPYGGVAAKSPATKEKELKKEIGELIKNFETNYKANLEQAETQPRPHTQNIAQLIDTAKKDLKKIKGKQVKLTTVTSKLSDEKQKEESWKKQDEEYNEALKKLEPLENLLQRLQQ